MYKVVELETHFQKVLFLFAPPIKQQTKKPAIAGLK